MPEPEALKVAGVILAAGSSTRMGRNKLLLELDGETVVRRAVRHAIEAGLAPVIVVLGHEAERVRAELDGLNCRTVVNPEPARGAGSSLKIGVREVGAVPGFVLSLADMPFVNAEMLAFLVARYRDGRPRLVMSRYGDVEAPPHLFDRSLFDELLAGEDERCAKPVIRRHSGEAAVAAWPDWVLQDIDRPEDYAHAKARVAGAGA